MLSQFTNICSFFQESKFAKVKYYLRKEDLFCF
jgi:hypothetical protein